MTLLAKPVLLTTCALAALVLTAAVPLRAEPIQTNGPVMTQTLAAAPLIPRDDLFGNPTRASGQISPDGKWLSWLAPKDGVLNVWLAPASNPRAGKAVTAATDRPIRSYFWSPDSKGLLYIQDKGGDENFLLYRIDIASGEETTLTPFENTRVQLIGTSHTIKDKVLVGLNNRDPRFHDAYLLDLGSGALTLVQQNDGYAGFLADDNLTLRMAIAPNAAGGMDFFPITDGKIAAAPSESTTLEDALSTSPAGFTTDGKTMYWIDSRCATPLR